MFHYSIFFSKETEGEKTSLPFCFEAVLPVSAEIVEAEWHSAFKNPEESWLWPSELSLPSAESDELDKGVFFQLAYQMPDPTDLSAPPKSYTYDYSILRLEHSPLVFAYQAEHGDGRRHPFTGGGTVSVIPEDGDSCRLRWEGAYHHMGNRVSAEDVFAHYFSLFFTTMAKNIRLHDERLKAA